MISSTASNLLSIENFQHLLPESKRNFFQEILGIVMADNDYHK